MVPPMSLAVAASATVAGAANEAPSTGDVSDTVGALFAVTVTVRVADVVLVPPLSVATALST